MDTDEDGFSDWYEHSYSGSITNINPSAADDGDGFLNGAENRAGTIPTLGTSLLQVSGFSLCTTGVVVRRSHRIFQPLRR